MPSSIDQNFRLDAAGQSFVLKISNSAELPEYLDAQIRALEHLARTPGFALPVPEVVRCSDGRSVVQAGRHRVWLVTWLDGMLIARLDSRSPELLRALGRALGDLDRRLAGFDDPAVHREFRWDLMQAPAILPLTENISDPAGRDLVRRRLRRFEAEVIPRLERLPFQVVHNDANDGNVLVVFGERFQAGLRELAASHPIIGDVRGLGLFIAAELVRDPESLEPATEEASAIVNQMRERGILLSTDGPFENVIKIKPPLVFTTGDADRVVSELSAVLAEDAFAVS